MDIKTQRKKFLIGALRRISYKWPPRSQALRGAKVAYGKYRCKQCREVFARKDVQLDHIKPVVDPKKGFTTWTSYLTRLLCAKEGFQVLCKPCHSVKTKKENKGR